LVSAAAWDWIDYELIKKGRRAFRSRLRRVDRQDERGCREQKIRALDGVRIFIAFGENPIRPRPGVLQGFLTGRAESV